MRYWALIAAVAVAVAGYGGYYFFVADAVVGGIETWSRDWRASGGIAEYDGIERCGFPYRVVVDVARPRLAAPGRGTVPVWEADRLQAVIQPWNFRHVILDLTGRHRLGPLATGPGRTTRLDLAVTEGLASHRRDGDDRLLDLAVDLKGLAGTAETRVGGQRLQAAITGERAQLHLRRSGRPDALGDVSLRLDRLAVGEWAWIPPFERLALLATVVGPEPPPADPRAMLVAWRDGGGTVEVAELTLLWGKVEIRAEGSIALDAETRPIGALTAKVKGHGELLERAVLAGAMRREDADQALPILNLLAIAAGGELSVPVTMQDGILWLGPVAVARLAPILPRRPPAR